MEYINRREGSEEVFREGKKKKRKEERVRKSKVGQGIFPRVPLH